MKVQFSYNTQLYLPFSVREPKIDLFVFRLQSAVRTHRAMLGVLCFPFDSPVFGGFKETAIKLIFSSSAKVS